MAITTTKKAGKVQTGTKRRSNLNLVQEKTNELYANDEILESEIAALEETIPDAAPIQTITVNGAAVPVAEKNAAITADKDTVGLGNVKNVDQTNAGNITAGTLPDGRLSANVAKKDTADLANYYTKTQVDEMHNVFSGGTHYIGAVAGTSSLAVAVVGNFYKASAKFTLGSTQVEIGDIVIAKQATTSFNAAAWDVIPSGDDGDVYADNAFPAGDKIVVSDGVGKKVKSSGKGIVGTVNSGSTDDNIPTAKGVYDFTSGGYVAKETGKGLSTNDYTTAEKSKLSGIAAGAQVNTVTGIKGGAESAYRTGNVDVTKINVGLGNVDNTSDADKPISTATQAALANKSGKLVRQQINQFSWYASGDDSHFPSNASHGTYVLGVSAMTGALTLAVLGVFDLQGDEVDVNLYFDGESYLIYSDVKVEGSVILINAV